MENGPGRRLAAAGRMRLAAVVTTALLGALAPAALSEGEPRPSSERRESIGTPPVGEAGVRPAGSLDAAERALRASDPDEARRLLAEALTLDAGNLELRHRALELLFDAGAVEQARELADEILRDHPDDPVVRLVRGLARLRLGRPNLAFDDIDAALKSDALEEPRLGRAEIARLDAAMAAERHHEVLDLLEGAAERGDFAERMRLGTALAALGRAERAVEAFSRALEAAANEAERDAARRAIIEPALAAGDLERARAALAGSLERAPGDPRLRAQQAALEEQLGERTDLAQAEASGSAADGDGDGDRRAAPPLAAPVGRVPPEPAEERLGNSGLATAEAGQAAEADAEAGEAVAGDPEAVADAEPSAGMAPPPRSGSSGEAAPEPAGPPAIGDAKEAVATATRDPGAEPPAEAERPDAPAGDTGLARAPVPPAPAGSRAEPLESPPVGEPEFARELRRAQTLAERGQPDEAARSLRALVERAPQGSPRRTEALEQLGRLLAPSDPRQAAEVFAQAHAEGRNPLMLRDAVIAYTNAGAVDQAYELLRTRLPSAGEGGLPQAEDAGRG